jgi:hypothetical protein
MPQKKAPGDDRGQGSPEMLSRAMRGITGTVYPFAQI